MNFCSRVRSLQVCNRRPTIGACRVCLSYTAENISDDISYNACNSRHGAFAAFFEFAPYKWHSFIHSSTSSPTAPSCILCPSFPQILQNLNTSLPPEIQLTNSDQCFTPYAGHCKGHIWPLRNFVPVIQLGCHINILGEMALTGATRELSNQLHHVPCYNYRVALYWCIIQLLCGTSHCLLRKSQLPGGSSSSLEPVATWAEGQWH